MDPSSHRIILVSIVASIHACHAWDPGSIPGQEEASLFAFRVQGKTSRSLFVTIETFRDAVAFASSLARSPVRARIDSPESPSVAAVAYTLAIPHEKGQQALDFDISAF